MFTLKLYEADGFRTFITQADAFTILRFNDGHVEISAHQAAGQHDSCRYDLYDPNSEGARADCVAPMPPRYAKAIVENEKGRTTEIIWPSNSTAPRALLAA